MNHRYVSVVAGVLLLLAATVDDAAVAQDALLLDQCESILDTHHLNEFPVYGPEQIQYCESLLAGDNPVDPDGTRAIPPIGSGTDPELEPHNYPIEEELGPQSEAPDLPPGQGPAGGHMNDAPMPPPAGGRMNDAPMPESGQYAAPEPEPEQYAESEETTGPEAAEPEPEGVWTEPPSAGHAGVYSGERQGEGELVTLPATGGLALARAVSD